MSETPKVLAWNIVQNHLDHGELCCGEDMANEIAEAISKAVTDAENDAKKWEEASVDWEQKYIEAASSLALAEKEIAELRGKQILQVRLDEKGEQTVQVLKCENCTNVEKRAEGYKMALTHIHICDAPGKDCVRAWSKAALNLEFDEAVDTHKKGTGTAELYGHDCGLNECGGPEDHPESKKKGTTTVSPQWECGRCHRMSRGRICTNCGTPRE